MLQQQAAHDRCIGIVLTGLVYAAIVRCSRPRKRPQAGDRRRARVLVRRLGHGRPAHRDRGPDAGAEGGAPAPGPRRLRHHREGPHRPYRAPGARAAGADLAAHRRARPQQALSLRRRHRGHLVLLLRRLERLLSRDAGAGRGARALSAGLPKPKAPPRPHRSGRFATRSIRTSCSTRSTRSRRWSWPAGPTRRRT